jgi:HEPN domain-containing protein
MDIEKQMAYWRSGATEDREAGLTLIRDGKTRHGLFFAHLALEKALKALVIRETKAVAPRILNLVRLAELARLNLSYSEIDILADMNQFQMEGRYPESPPAMLMQMEAEVYMETARELFQWLMNL